MKYQHRVVGLLALLAIITYLDRVCIAVAGPRIQDSLHISPQAWGWVASVFFISYAAFEIPTGALADRIGSRRVLTRIVIWWSTFTSLTGLVSSYPLLLLVRFCFGMGEAGAYPSAATVIGRWIPKSKRARLGDYLDDQPDRWRPCTAAGSADPNPLRLARIVLSLRDPGRDLERGLVRLVPGFAARHARHHAARTPGNRRRSAAAPWRCAMARGAALVLSTLPYIVGAVANIMGGLTSDRLAQRFGLKTGRRTVGVVGLVTAAICMAAAILAASGQWSLIFLSLAYAGILFQQPNLCAVCLDTGREHAGAVFGFMNTAANVASAVSSIVFGYLVAYTGSYNAPFIPMLVLLGVGSLLWLKVDPTQPLFEAQ